MSIMKNKTTREEYLKILKQFKELYATKYGITSIGLIGSVARDEHTEESDVDVIVEAPTMTIFICMDIQIQLQKMMRVHVDVVTKSPYMRPRFQARVEREAIYV